MSSWSKTAERFCQLQAEFVRAELEIGAVFADIALSADHEQRRTRNLKNAMKAYTIALLFAGRVALSDEHRMELADRVEALRHRLVALGEMGKNVLGRRLDDRIRRLAAIAEDFAHDSPMRQTITQRIKT